MGFKIYGKKSCIWTTLSRDLLKNTCYQYDFIDTSIDKKLFLLRFRGKDITSCIF